jgi:hypothetical protein
LFFSLDNRNDRDTLVDYKDIESFHPAGLLARNGFNSVTAEPQRKLRRDFSAHPFFDSSAETTFHDPREAASMAEAGELCVHEVG